MELRSFYALKGRALRSEYWLVTLVAVLAAIAIFSFFELVLAMEVFSKEVTEYSVSEAVAYFSFSLGMAAALMPVTLRRLHDRNRGLGWFLFYTAASLLMDFVDFLSLPFVHFADLSPDSSQALYGISGIIGLIMVIDLGFLRGTEGINRFGPDPLLISTGDPDIFN